MSNKASLVLGDGPMAFQHAKAKKGEPLGHLATWTWPQAMLERSGHLGTQNKRESGHLVRKREREELPSVAVFLMAPCPLAFVDFGLGPLAPFPTFYGFKPWLIWPCQGCFHAHVTSHLLAQMRFYLVFMGP